ncbi:MAG TPA: competence/damage-inducible protein A [Candidatus Cloacimonadota bacterium]|nr:competence/damage-inducible protein A [Candidatus Cloacimonadota bacterium]HOV16613.1 competence/damage-inducible protein A [Candidatus Cloacimonadota bacterium]HQL15149.1 competence/damage-inducible protein A [Candidatus Cloacimonadota bacterium]
MTAKVNIINIGNELLLGQTINTNLSWLGKELAALGLPVTRAEIVKDEPEEIKSALQKAWNTSEIVIMSGGLGPTNDDVTKAVICDFFNKQLEFRAEVWASVEQIFLSKGKPVPEINRSQAMVPSDFHTLINSKGTAPGLYYREGDKSFFALPGVPIELQYLFSEYIKAILQKNYHTEPLIIRNLHTWKISESALAEKLPSQKLPEGVSLAWLPQTGRVDLRIYGPNQERVEKVTEQIRNTIAEYIWGIDDETPALVLHQLLLEKRMTLSVAESCTGGWLQKLLTDNSGASNYLRGGVVSYSNEVKISVLHVPRETIAEFGAVSVQTAKAMAEGVRALCQSDLGIAITGIAGPEGGSVEKPVGTVCFALSDNNGTKTERVIFDGDRNSIRWKAAEYMLFVVIEYLRSNS